MKIKEIAVVDGRKLINALKKARTEGDVIIKADGVDVLSGSVKETIECDLGDGREKYAMIERGEVKKLIKSLEDVQNFVKIAREEKTLKFIENDYDVFTTDYKYIDSSVYIRCEPMVETLLKDMRVEVPYEAWDEYLDGLLRRVSDRVNRKVHIIVNKSGKMVMKNRYKSLTTKVKGIIPNNIHFVTDLYKIYYIHKLTKHIVLTRSDYRLGVMLPESTVLLKCSYWAEE